MDNVNQPAPELRPSPIQQPPKSDGSNKIVIWFMLGIVIIIVIVGGIYFFLSKQTIIPQTQTIVTQTSASPVVQENLENDLDSINIDASGSNDFSSVDQDLQQL